MFLSYGFRRRCVIKSASHALLYSTTMDVSLQAFVFVFLIPFVQLRAGLMIGSWSQHALVDELESDPDYRSSITLIYISVSTFSLNLNHL